MHKQGKTTYETRRVVIPHSGGITKCLKHRVGFKDFIFYFRVFVGPLRQILQDQLGGLGFACSALTAVTCMLAHLVLLWIFLEQGGHLIITDWLTCSSIMLV